MVVIGQLLQRLVTRPRDFAVAIADLHTPQAGHAVDQAFAFGIPQVDSLRAGDDARAFAGQRLGLREGMNVVRGVQRLPAPRVAIDTL